MKKLLLIVSMVASSVAIGATTYDGENYEYTKANAPSKSVYVKPENVSNVASKKINNWWSNRANNGVESNITDVAQQSIIDWSTPYEYELTAEMIASDLYENPIEIPVGQTVTIIPTTNCTPDLEIGVTKPENNKLRNFEVYLPNEPEVRAGLPCGFLLTELPKSVRHVYVNGVHMVPTLPAKISVRQPYSKLVIGEIVTYDDGWDWDPVITNCNAVWNGTSLAAPRGKRLFEGTNLQAGMSIKVAYPISGGTIVTNDVTNASDIGNNGWLTGTFYEYVSGFEFTPPSGQAPASSGDPVTFTYIYETKAGKSPATCTYTFDPFAE